MKRLKYLVSLGVILLAPLMAVPVAYAASGTMYLSPASGSVVNGNNISVTIYENSGATQVNGVQANLTFPASLLSVNSVSAGSSWGIVAQNTYNNTNGTINFAAGNISPLSGVQVVATISFKAKASSGSASVNFAAGTTVTESNGSGTPLTLTTTGGTYTLAAPPTPPPPPPPPAPPAPSPTPPPSPPGTKPPPPPSPTSPTPTPAASGLQISAVAATDIGANTATITWKTSAPATSQVEYGLENGGYKLSAADAAMVTDHKIILKSEAIQPGVTYHYRVKSTTADSKSATSADYTFTTKGASLQITVLSKDGKPVSGAEVTVKYATTLKGGEKSVTGKTDKNGQVTLAGFPVGKVSATIAYGGKKTNFNDLQVKPIDAKNAAAQPLTFNIDSSRNTPLLAVLLPLLLLGILAGLLISRRKKPKDWHFPDITPPASSGGTPAVGGPTGTVTKSEPTLIQPEITPDQKK